MEEDKTEQIFNSLDAMVSISERILDAASSIPKETSGGNFARTTSESSSAKERVSKLEAINSEKGSLLAAIKSLYEIAQTNEVLLLNFLNYL